MSVPFRLTRKCLSGMPRLTESSVSADRGVGATEDKNCANYGCLAISWFAMAHGMFIEICGVELIQESPWPQSPVIEGLVAGMAHHSLCTVYLGSDIFAALVFYLVANFVFLAFFLLNPPLSDYLSPSMILRNIIQFNSGYVFPWPRSPLT